MSAAAFRDWWHRPAFPVPLAVLSSLLGILGTPARGVDYQGLMPRLPRLELGKHSRPAGVHWTSYRRGGTGAECRWQPGQPSAGPVGGTRGARATPPTPGLNTTSAAGIATVDPTLPPPPARLQARCSVQGAVL